MEKRLAVYYKYAGSLMPVGRILQRVVRGLQ